jgi:alpha-amylase/alpha-mannosidase (GH57 family)
MSQPARLPVVLLWHMHQPQYRDALTGEFVLPWTYLHAIKDYIDMAAHLESQPNARAVGTCWCYREVAGSARRT